MYVRKKNELRVLILVQMPFVTIFENEKRKEMCPNSLATNIESTLPNVKP